MTRNQAVGIERAAPGDRAPTLRSLARHYEARRAAILAHGQDLTPGRQAALTKAAKSLRQARSLASRYGIALDREDIEFAPGALSCAQRDALTAALVDPLFCRRLADAALQHAPTAP